MASSGEKSVFAHFIVGNAAAMTAEQWEADIREAQRAHIDGFALNIATQDSYTDTVLQTAYAAAETVGNFSLFLSFDYESGGAWPEDRVVSTVNTYKDSSAQFYYQGKPLVSTFEGTSNAGDWTSIKAATGCSFIPSWTSLGQSGIQTYIDEMDGMLSWDAWPEGAQDMTTTSDEAWIEALGNKSYMMPVSPWFYTNLPDYSKNWLWRGDDLWHDRWQQVIELQPPLVEILTWNDYGETHYIGPIYEAGIPTGAATYVTGNPHDDWRALLPYYIDAYKSNNQTTISTTAEKITYWYRINPSGSGSANGTTGNDPSQGQPVVNPALVSLDKVFTTVLVAAPSTVTIQIGDADATTLRAVTAGINHFSVPFNGQTGAVTISVQRNGEEVVSITGPAITDQKIALGLQESQQLAFHLGGQLPEAQYVPVPSPTPSQERGRETLASASKSTVCPEAYTKPYCEFMTENPTIFHAVDTFTKQLEQHGYRHLSERAVWTPELRRGGKYYTTRNGSALIAFVVGKEYQSGNGMGIVAGHVDALTARLKPVSKLPNKTGFAQLAVAPYAGGLNETWWDRDLSIGGRVLVRDPITGKVETRLVKLGWPIARIPTLAPHFGAPSQGPFNKETQMVPIVGIDNSDLFQGGEAAQVEGSGIKPGTFAATQPPKLVKVISGELGITDYSTIVSWELELFDSQPAQVGGLDKDLIFAGRIDDKLCCFAAQEALLASPDEMSPGIVKMVGMFDDEEIGSLLRQGARSNFMSSVMERITEAFAASAATYGPNLLAQTVANSFLVSSDVIHAVNPNFANVYLENHAPRLNVGVAISADPNGHMTTDSVSTAILQRIAHRCGATLQVFQIRNDSRSGGTIGPMTSARIGMRAIDAGIPQLSMHSIRATTGSLDPGLGVKLFKGFFDYFEEVDKEFLDF
ncbi:hypothetical protein ASPZODRAFT_150690 [Penicilliopsis zonata CBS 506.65]|uniref:Glycosyl hydrolase family 71-domain-containing protein n=1 Tax=Penicilliopsis zonata CBS 506.65 TaxID=1073090 RepID=A0A1L9SML1_9EURO|nr:hypothetical protein ASPZODRAFT_150690 [Penicilliopsis zonata CBS 506.65]OJJ48465.1 hypothetical protein ASPZODRAFT_150690 [Penicilliopsis zonata CBS 506.65]